MVFLISHCVNLFIMNIICDKKQNNFVILNLMTRIMYNGMKKSFPGLRVVSEEHEEYDGPVTLPRLDADGLREDVSLQQEDQSRSTPCTGEYPGRGDRARPDHGVDRPSGRDAGVHRETDTGLCRGC